MALNKECKDACRAYKSRHKIDTSNTNLCELRDKTEAKLSIQNKQKFEINQIQDIEELK